MWMSSEKSEKLGVRFHSEWRTCSGIKSRCLSDVDESIHPQLGVTAPPSSLIQQQLATVQS